MAHEFSKRMRGMLRNLASTAYERELRSFLDDLGGSFDRWRRDELDTLSLADELDQFANSRVRRRLSSRYATNSLLHINVAAAILRGLLTPSEVPPEVSVALASTIEELKRDLADGIISFDTKADYC